MQWDVARGTRDEDGTPMTAAETHMNIGAIERSVVASLYRRTKDQQAFSSDDLRRLELDKYLSDRNGIGGLFAWMVTANLIREVGRAPSAFPSTHHRKVGLYVWTGVAHRLYVWTGAAHRNWGTKD